MNIFDYTDYKSFVSDFVEDLSQGKRGMWLKLAHHIRMHTSTVSQVFKGDRELTLEQGYLVGQFLGLSQLEQEYFITLIEKARAGSVALEKLFERRAEKMRAEGQKVASRFPQSKTLSETDKSIFYSHWYYSGIHLLSSISEYQTVEAIADYFNLPIKTVAPAVQFLLKAGLLVEKEGRLNYGPHGTHVGADSPLSSRHHTNWRLKTMERFSEIDDSELVFTSPMTLSVEDFQKIRSLILKFLEEAKEVYSPSSPEVMACLNIDWVLAK